jgi:hypothetical protein
MRIAVINKNNNSFLEDKDSLKLSLHEGFRINQKKQYRN